ncbi:hypothetical protein [Streptomyces sp. NPDC058108]|uniref:hypothetical protein n=1 Tax=Streptomyces sp. NPDC058108 TaxID=3346344 RepID=UPI0036E5724F
MDELWEFIELYLLKAWRGIATTCNKIPDSYLAGLSLRASMIWIKDLTRGAP